MKKSNKPWLRSLAAVLVCAGLASCNPEDNRSQTSGTPLPEGEYPLLLTASVEGRMSRAAGKDEWTGGEEIGVRIGAGEGGARYTIGANRSVQPATEEDVLYWQNTANADVTAWWPYEPQNNTDITDQSAGFVAFDFLTAKAEDQNYRSEIVLAFKHQMAKVSYMLEAGEGITEEELKEAVVTLLGDATATFKDGVLAQANQTNGEITSCYDGESRTGAALLVPQDMTGYPFIKVSIKGNDFLYTPASEAAGKLQAGYHNAYTITVKANGIEVTAATGGTWTNDGSEEVTSKTVLVKYTADEVKKGDYIYQDGTISDGGLRTIYTDGTMMSLSGDNKPKPVVGRTVVGVVFWTPSETDPTGRNTPASLTDDKLMSAEHPDCTHGLAVAVKKVTYNGSETMVWQPEGSYDHVKVWQENTFTHASKDNFVSIASNIYSGDNINKIYGYQNTLVLRVYNAYCQTGGGNSNNMVQPVAALDAFKTSNPAPVGSTGWFLPSVKELHMLCYKDVDHVYMAYDASYTTTRDIVNTSLSAAGGDDLVADFYWSSSEDENRNDRAFYVDFYDASVGSWVKDRTYRVRAVCAF